MRDPKLDDIWVSKNFNFHIKIVAIRHDSCTVIYKESGRITDSFFGIRIDDLNELYEFNNNLTEEEIVRDIIE